RGDRAREIVLPRDEVMARLRLAGADPPDLRDVEGAIEANGLRVALEREIRDLARHVPDAVAIEDARDELHLPGLLIRDEGGVPDDRIRRGRRRADVTRERPARGVLRTVVGLLPIRVAPVPVPVVAVVVREELD